eukprot:Polyplicarium_translucidae@DN735_c0_g1_i1.p5
MTFRRVCFIRLDTVVAMRVRVKNLKNEEEELDISTEDTIKTVKEKITSLSGSICLIHMGRIMVDDVRVSETSIKEGDALIVLANKQKPPVQPRSQPVVAGLGPAAPATAAPAEPPPVMI